MLQLRYILCCLFFITIHCFGFQKQEIKNEGFSISTIYYEKTGNSLDSISAHLLSEDLFKITGDKPAISTSEETLQKSSILIGNINAEFIQKQLAVTVPKTFKKQKESYYQGWSKDKKHFIIAGTDPRGTAYGVFDLAEKNGVSPWYWWADVPVKKSGKLKFTEKDYFSKAPSVEFRGIFLNDEDWGLQPWAAKNFETETGDIGPKTYAKIFELLLRLKANAIWPAMHPSTKAFFHYPGNKQIAEKYHIVLGSSHAEPMLRNNVDEWKDDFGHFDYKNNKAKINEYWESRIEESKDLDAIFTVGMRGIHDSGMEGVNSIEEAATVLESVIQNQRSMLEKHRDKNAAEIPQAFTIYKEVLDVYDHGMDLPDDVTLVWTDDNYGYIRRLGNQQEQERIGGSGVYYHASYWGRPHNYLWLSTTNPALIWEEMHKAYEMNARKIWILNVGYLKPAEYNMQLFLDMAYDMSQFESASELENHRNEFYTTIFGKELGTQISALRKEYYDFAWERKPEFMGWSQTEPNTEVKSTSYSAFDYGDEIQHRLETYQNLGRQSDRVFKNSPDSLKNGYFQLVHYPIKGAMFMNQKQLNRDLAEKYAKQGRISAKSYQQKSLDSYDSIQKITARYNTISDGKWKGIMSMKPRNLPVFEKPEFNYKIKNTEKTVDFYIEGEHDRTNKLPTFYKGANDTYFLDIFLTKIGIVKWSLNDLPEWIMVSNRSGELNSDFNALQNRIYFQINWDQYTKSRNNDDHFILQLGRDFHQIDLQIKEYEHQESGVFEKNGLAVVYAENFQEQSAFRNYKWQKIADLGYSGAVMQAMPLNEKPLDTIDFQMKHPKLTYEISTESTAESAVLILNALPTHPITNKHGVRIGVKWDNEPIKILNFETQGRSATWKENVLSNKAEAKLPVNLTKPGKHTLNIYMIDPGVALDFIYLKTTDKSLPYGLLKETKLKN
ncbi:glycosyl hydrolase 115 family protein [Zunongwangia endophytica]|uniref:Glycosyl hydrolase 115 family protein n=1 Tax=Zunongwangia endophytica TaxID=1808945 RepID=A0ABV8H6A9_9FLAO|nr:glycosyl hydrolase 115 family protein [Zunongwangia endophytica]MDN3594905.1 glycosyl hydrolase 115 family protein [Zunongwangia endophytica]